MNRLHTQFKTTHEQSTKAEMYFYTKAFTFQNNDKHKIKTIKIGF